MNDVWVIKMMNISPSLWRRRQRRRRRRQPFSNEFVSLRYIEHRPLFFLHSVIVVILATVVCFNNWSAKNLHSWERTFSSCKLAKNLILQPWVCSNKKLSRVAKLLISFCCTVLYQLDIFSYILIAMDTFYPPSYVLYSIVLYCEYTGTLAVFSVASG